MGSKGMQSNIIGIVHFIWIEIGQIERTVIHITKLKPKLTKKSTETVQILWLHTWVNLCFTDIYFAKLAVWWHLFKLYLKMS